MPVERRLEPARAHEQGDLLAHLVVRARAQHAGARGAPDHRLEEPFAPRAGLGLGRQQHRHVGVLEPQVALRPHRQVVAQGARQHGAVDAAGRGARDDVDDDAQFDLAADLAQELEIDRLGVVLAVLRVGVVEERGRGAPAAIGDRVEPARGADELQDLLADAVHVHGERDAAEADERDAKLFFPHDVPGDRPPAAPWRDRGILDDSAPAAR